MSTAAGELSADDKLAVFKAATRALPVRYAQEIAAGMRDDELVAALKEVLGIFGGSGGPERLSVSYQGAGLKIWGGWRHVNHVLEPPLFTGSATVAMARAVYGIADPDDRQFCLALT